MACHTEEPCSWDWLARQKHPDRTPSFGRRMTMGSALNLGLNPESMYAFPSHQDSIRNPCTHFPVIRTRSGIHVRISQSSGLDPESMYAFPSHQDSIRNPCTHFPVIRTRSGIWARLSRHSEPDPESRLIYPVIPDSIRHLGSRTTDPESSSG